MMGFPKLEITLFDVDPILKQNTITTLTFPDIFSIMKP